MGHVYIGVPRLTNALSGGVCKEAAEGQQRGFGSSPLRPSLLVGGATAQFARPGYWNKMLTAGSPPWRRS